MKYQMISSYLTSIKRHVVSNNYTFTDRSKNVRFMRDNSLDTNDFREIVLDLTPNDWVGGPEPDRGGYPGDVLKFKSSFVEGKTIYIKFRYNPPDEVVCISFHEDE